MVVSLFTALIATAQTREISGVVSDDKGEPVPFASVILKTSGKGVSADANGAFKVKAKTGDVLVISGVGFDSKEVTVSASSTVSVMLVRKAGADEVVVVTTALGEKRQPKELGYSTAKVSSKELTQSKSVNLQNGLTGKVSGLNIQTVNNGVFADVRMLLRGIRSLTGNNQPMLVVDGAPISLGFVNSLNPNDIQDAVLLKSSSATAIYGPDGVNGALVITMKKGTKAKPQITLSHTTQLETVSYMPKLQTQFGSGSSVDAFGYGQYDSVENQCYGPAFDGSLVQIGRTSPGGTKFMTQYVARPEEKRKFWNTGVTNQTDISFSTSDFYMSAQNVAIRGVMPKDMNNRTSFRIRANKDYNNFSASFGVTYTRGDYNVNAGSSFGNGRDYTPYWTLLNTPMHIPVTQFKDWNKPYGNDYSSSSSYWSSPDGYFNDYYSNPYFMVDNFRTKGRSDDVIGNLELGYKPAPGLNIVYRLNTTITNGVAKSTQGAYTYSAYSKSSGKSIASTGDLVGAVGDASSFSSRINSELFATYSKKVKDFNLQALLGTSFRDSYSKGLSMSSSNLGMSVFNILVRKGEPTVSESSSRSKLNRYFGRLTANYKGWANAEVTGSYDIDSRLGYFYNFNMKNISFFYPGANVSLVLSDAIPALKNNKTLSFLKVSAAVSKTGNVNLGPYSLENTYSLASGFPFGTLQGFTSDNTLRLSEYKPEFVNNKEVGLEAAFNKNKINFGVSAYTQDNTNQLITVAYSAATGFPSALLNAAEFTNKGLEFDLKLTPIVKINNVSIDLKLNYSYQTNEVKKLVDGVDELGIGNGNFIIKGQSAYMFKLTDYLKDAQGRVIVDKATGYPSLDPVVKMFGTTLPKHLFGATLSVNWKQFSFNAVADYRGGNQVYSGLGPDMDFSGISIRSAQNNRQPFIFPNSSYDDGTGKYVANTSVYTQNGGYGFWSQSMNTSVNSNYLADGSFWKLREVSLSYTIPNSVFNKFTRNAIKGATFTLTGRNLLMFLPKTNEWTDPEFSNTTGNAQGVNTRDNTPPTRIFGANLTLNF